jgi:hypothetical protein
MESIFKGFSSAKPSGNVLPAGNHAVKVNKIYMTDSFTKPDGSAKTDVVWDKPTPQLGVQFTGEGGVITSFLNGLGYDHASDFDPEVLQKGGFVEVEGYVAKLLESGKYERYPNEARTESCVNILNKLLWACGCEEGTTLKQFGDLVAAGQAHCFITVEEHEYDGKQRREVTSTFKQAVESQPTLGLE